MQNTLCELEAIYNEYEQSVAQSKRENANMQFYFSKMFVGGVGANPGDGHFANAVKVFVENFADTKPESVSALEIMRFVLDNGKSTESRAVSMQEAVQGYLLPLVPFLDTTDARKLLADYYDKRTARRLLPVQKKLMLAIREQSVN